MDRPTKSFITIARNNNCVTVPTCSNLALVRNTAEVRIHHSKGALGNWPGYADSAVPIVSTSTMRAGSSQRRRAAATESGVTAR